jgi:hypothetical protein
VLRRGPSRQVASLLWDRSSGEVTLGQWLKGRIYEHRSDLSPDGRHMIVFAGDGQRWWTAISRAPWLRALCFVPQGDTWHGGGAFDAEGRVFFNGRHAPDPLPDKLTPAAQTAFPHGTDGFHMGGLYTARMVLRGWTDTGGEGYAMALEKPAEGGWTLRQTVAQGAKDRALVSIRYALVKDGEETDTDWDWAEPWNGGLQVARAGALWSVPLTETGPGEPTLIHDFNASTFEAIAAPYEGLHV